MAKNLIRLYEQNTTNFANNGLTILQPISCKIKRNLQEYTYQLEMTHLLNDKGMMLVEDRIIGFKDQFFRISSIRKNLKEVNIVANHVFFDLNKNFIEDINIKDKTGSMALSQILNGTSYKHSFTATSDIDTVASSRMVRKNVVTALIGDIDNSFINRWGGELDIDGFSFKLNKQIGKDDGYTIKYGKNLTGLDLQLNMLEVVTRIRPVGFDGIEIEDLYVDSPYINNYALPIIKEIKYENVKWTGSPNYEEREDDDSYIYENLSDAQAKLVELATNEFTVNEIDLPQTTINIEFIELSKTEEYEHLKFLQNINIGDTVHVYHKALDINLKSRCIEYVYDCILNKYETIALGSYTKNFFSKTESTNNKVDTGDLDIEYSGIVNDILQQTQDHLNNAITQAMGGYVYKTNNALYIMDTDDISTAQKIWVWNKNGLAFSSNGVNGPYTTGITMDGYIVGSMISANSIVGEQIQANSIKAANLEIDVQKKITSATDEETVRTLIKADLDGFQVNISNTYETKADAISKINGVNNSISTLVGRVNSAESKITDTAITNVVKQNFYTKTETDEQITDKGYQTESQVQQTVDKLQLKFTQSGGYNRVRNGCFKNQMAHWNKWGSATVSTKVDTGHDYGNSIVIVTTANNQGITQIVDELKIGKDYTFSAYAYGSANSCGIQVNNGGNYISAKLETSNSWTKISLTFTASATSVTLQIGRGGWGTNGTHMFTAVQLEEGVISTSYSPHPNEVYDGITTIDKDGITVSASDGANTNFNALGMNSFNNSGQQTLGIRNGGMTFHPWNTNQLGAYITQSSLHSEDASANGLAISTANNGTYISLGTSSLSDANSTLNMDQALTISSNDNFQPKGINFWKDVHAHGYGIRQLSHLKLAGSSAIQFDYLNTSPSTIYEAVDNGHSLYVMGGYQMHLGCMAGTGTPKGMIWFKGQTDTHSYTTWDFHNYTMYNMKTASTYANYETRRISESYGVTSNVDGVRYVYRNVELVNGKAIRSIPLEYKGCEYDIVSIVCKGRGNAWVQDEDVDKFVIEGDCQSVNIEIIIHEIEQNLHTVALDEAYMEPLPQKTEPEIPTVITNVSPDTL